MKTCPKCRRNYEDAVGFCPRDGEVLQESPESLVGRVLDGKYRVEEFVAQGGMGAVYRARHILLGDTVVIKTLRPEMRGNSEWLRRFQREGRAARSFRHPNAVTVYDLSAADDGLIYMVMEYVEGHTLAAELRERVRFSPAEALAVLGPVADVLDAAHARGVVHRDLKPDNVMLGRTEAGAPFVKVLDLGIAKMVEAGDAGETSSLTIAGQVLGTPYYMSPEQWGELQRDARSEIDGRADVYSLGVIAFELVAGRRPLGGDTLQELRRAHVAAALPPLGAFAPDVPDGFARAVERALAKDRGDRPATAGEFVDELRASLGLQPRGHAGGAATGPRGADTGGDGRPTPHAAAGAPATNPAGSARTSAPHDTADTVLDDSLRRPRSAGETAGRHRADAPDAGGATRRMDSAGQPAAPGDESLATALAPERAPSREDEPAGAAAARTVALAGPHGGAFAPPQQARPGASGQRSSRALLFGGAALVFVALVGVGAWLAWRGAREGGAGGNVSNASASNASADVPAKRVEALSYWVESYGVSGRERPRRVAGESLALASGEYFQFHFVARERGFLYILGPGGDGNARTLFLGARGGGMMKANQLGAGADFAFPCVSCVPDSLRLDRHPGVEEFTVIFSPAPLISPQALTLAGLHELTPEEVKELEDFRARHAAASPALSVTGEADEGRAVSVLVPESREAGGPVIFDIRIKHE